MATERWVGGTKLKAQAEAPVVMAGMSFVVHRE
jgi:hypothetical protein